MRATESHREIPRATERYREVPRGTESTESHREPPRATEAARVDTVSDEVRQVSGEVARLPPKKRGASPPCAVDPNPRRKSAEEKAADIAELADSAAATFESTAARAAKCPPDVPGAGENDMPLAAKPAKKPPAKKPPAKKPKEPAKKKQKRESESDDGSDNESDSESECDDQNEFEVEAILKHKGKGEARRYLVHWKGYPKNQVSPTDP